MPAPSLLLQTTYAELLERCAANAFTNAFPEKGAFTAKTVKGRRYWYFQTSSKSGRSQRYVGPESPELLERISAHTDARNDERERTSLVSALVRQGMPRPNAEIAKVVAAFADAGAFRLGSVLVGTIAYQAYPAILGEKLPVQQMETRDVDIAQFASTSKQTGDQIAETALAMLRKTDPTFASVPNIAVGQKPVSYQARRGSLRVDFLTPNEGADSDEPVLLPALQTYAQPLRFLDYLIHDAQPAVLLYGPGIYVSVPEPQRYAIHKLIVAQRRTGAEAKRDKDIAQADALLTVLTRDRPHEVRLAWEEAADRGKRWIDALLTGMRQLPQRSRDLTLQAIDRSRSIIPGLDLQFQNPAPRYVFDRDVIIFEGTANGEKVQCAISREALEDYFGADGLSIPQRMEKFQANRTEIEALARAKYLSRPVEAPAFLLIKTADVAALRKAESVARRRR